MTIEWTDSLQNRKGCVYQHFEKSAMSWQRGNRNWNPRDIAFQGPTQPTYP